MQGAAYSRPKSLLLLAYLALEGAQDRHFLSEVFFGQAKDRLGSLRTALKRLRREAPGTLDAGGDPLRARVECDAQRLLSHPDAGELELGVQLYTGPFLAGVHLPNPGVELEEWVFGTREFIAARVRGALLMAGQSPLFGRLRQQARGFEIELSLSVAEARRALLRSGGSGKTRLAPADELGAVFAGRPRPRLQLVLSGQNFFTGARQAGEDGKRAPQRERLRLGTTTFLNLPFLPQALKRFHHAYPAAELTFRELFSIQQLAALAEGSLDVGFVTLPVEAELIWWEMIWQEPYVALLPQAHILAKLAEVPLEALADEPFVVHPREVNPPLYDHIFSLLRGNGIEPKHILEGAVSQTRNNLVAGGFGFTLTLPSWPADLPGLVKRPLHYADHHAPMSMNGAIAWHRDNFSVPVAAFIGIVRTLKLQHAAGAGGGG